MGTKTEYGLYSLFTHTLDPAVSNQVRIPVCPSDDLSAMNPYGNTDPDRIEIASGPLNSEFLTLAAEKIRLDPYFAFIAPRLLGGCYQPQQSTSPGFVVRSENVGFDHYISRYLITDKPEEFAAYYRLPQLTPKQRQQVVLALQEIYRSSLDSDQGFGLLNVSTTTLLRSVVLRREQKLEELKTSLELQQQEAWDTLRQMWPRIQTALYEQEVLNYEECLKNTAAVSVTDGCRQP